LAEAAAVTADVPSTAQPSGLQANLYFNTHPDTQSRINLTIRDHSLAI
jgi:hypothetical protein